MLSVRDGRGSSYVFFLCLLCVGTFIFSLLKDICIIPCLLCPRTMNGAFIAGSSKLAVLGVLLWSLFSFSFFIGFTLLNITGMCMGGSSFFVLVSPARPFFVVFTPDGLTTTTPLLYPIVGGLVLSLGLYFSEGLLDFGCTGSFTSTGPV